MEFYQLKTFIAVAEEGSLSRAATKVFVSLPAVSAQIKALEDEFGVQLFNRTAKGVHLTTAGSRLLVEAHAILAAGSKMTTAAQLLRDELLGCARIGVLTDTLPLRLGELILDLSYHYPKLEVRVRRDVSSGIVNAIQNGELEGGFALLDQLPDNTLTSILMEIDLVVAIPTAMQIDMNSITLHELFKLPWIDSVTGCALYNATQTLFKQAPHRRNASHVADSDGALRSMIASGLGAGILRRTEAEDGVQKGEFSIWPCWAGKTYLCWVCSPTMAQSPIAEAISGGVHRVWADCNVPCGSLDCTAFPGTHHVPSLMSPIQ
jgi:DNA-binding transcriptional LysR family regulator